MLPLGQRYDAPALLALERSFSGQEENGIAGHGQSGLASDRQRRPDLGFPDPDDLLFVAMIDLDVPSNAPLIRLQSLSPKRDERSRMTWHAVSSNRAAV